MTEKAITKEVFVKITICPWLKKIAQKVEWAVLLPLRWFLLLFPMESRQRVGDVLQWFYPILLLIVAVWLFGAQAAGLLGLVICAFLIIS
jgi:hypothetical protein